MSILNIKRRPKPTARTQLPTYRWFVISEASLDHREPDGIQKATRCRLVDGIEALVAAARGGSVTVLTSPHPNLTVTTEFVKAQLAGRADISLGSAALMRSPQIADIPEAIINLAHHPQIVIVQIISREDLKQLLVAGGQEKLSPLVCYGTIFKFEPATGELTYLHRGCGE